MASVHLADMGAALAGTASSPFVRSHGGHASRVRD